MPNNPKATGNPIPMTWAGAPQRQNAEWENYARPTFAHDGRSTSFRRDPVEKRIDHDPQDTGWHPPPVGG